MESPDSEKQFYFQWHFIERCNLRCRHCYQREFDCDELDEEKLLKIAGILEQTLKKWKRSGRVSLTGGEPFLRKDLLLKLLKFFEASESFHRTGILTNGTLVDEDIADRMKGFSKLKEIQVSLDGARAETHDAVRGTGSFDKALDALRLLKHKGFTVSIMFTLHKRNRQDVPELIDMAEALGVDFLTIERMVPFNENDITEFFLNALELKEIYEAIYDKKREMEKRGTLKVRVSRPLWGLVDETAGGFCPAGFTSLAILHDGTVLPCRRLEIPVGNILDDGLFKLWYTSDVLWTLRKKNGLGEKCRTCGLLGNCGGCRAIAYAVSEDFMADDPQCWKE